MKAIVYVVPGTRIQFEDLSPLATVEELAVLAGVQINDYTLFQIDRGHVDLDHEIKDGQVVVISVFGIRGFGPNGCHRSTRAELLAFTGNRRRASC